MRQWDAPQNDPTRRMPYVEQPVQPAPGRRGYTDSTANPFGAASDRAFGIVSMVLALLGGIVGVVALTGLEWFKRGVSFSDVGRSLDAAGNSANGFASAYFGWLAWTFLVVGVVAAVASSFPSPALRIVRVIGVVVGIAAAGLSFLALQLNDNESYTECSRARASASTCWCWPTC